MGVLYECNVCGGLSCPPNVLLLPPKIPRPPYETFQAQGPIEFGLRRRHRLQWFISIAPAWYQLGRAEVSYVIDPPLSFCCSELIGV